MTYWWKPKEKEDPEKALEVLNSLLDAGDGLDTNEDDYYTLIWWTGSAGRQPVVWPMKMHAHDQDCGRA